MGLRVELTYFDKYNMNDISCKGAFDCDTLYHREECSLVSYTCGACLQGYISGIDGASNSPCVASAQLGDATASTALRSVALEVSQSCVQNCNNQGTCEFQDISTGLSLTECIVLDTTCRAVCLCDEGFAGASCDVKEAEMRSLQSLRFEMINALKAS